MARALQLGLNLGYWAGGPPEGAAETTAEAERLGFHSMWTAEAYGSDALTPLAWWGARTQRLHLGTAIAQISARTPAATAMAAMTLDHLSGGRVILGLGVSGPQVVEGWYGQPFAKPLARMREYIGILRAIWAREPPVESQGPHFPLPLPDGTGLGKRSRRASARCARTSRSTWPPRGRRTSRWPGSCATAGWPCSSRPITTASTGRRSRRASAGRRLVAAPRSSRWRPRCP